MCWMFSAPAALLILSAAAPERKSVVSMTGVPVVDVCQSIEAAMVFSSNGKDISRAISLPPTRRRGCAPEDQPRSQRRLGPPGTGRSAGIDGRTRPRPTVAGPASDDLPAAQLGGPARQR